MTTLRIMCSSPRCPMFEVRRILSRCNAIVMLRIPCLECTRREVWR